MKKLILISAFILLWPLAGFAQEVPKNEISGGFSELRETQQDKPRYAPGFYVSYARNFNSWLAAEAEYSGHFETQTRQFIAAGPGGGLAIYEDRTKIADHLLLFGPKFTYRKIERVNLFAHALGGLRTSTTDETFPVGVFPNVTNTTVHRSGTTFAVAAGGGVDINITKRFAIRAAQADYVRSRQPLLSDRNDLRLSTGLVFRF